MIKITGTIKSEKGYAMQIIGNKNRKRQIVIFAAIGALLLGGVATALFVPSSPFALNKKQEDRPENTPDYNAPTDEQKKAGEQAKEDFLKKQEEAEKNQQNSPQTDPDASSNKVNITITSVDQGQIRTMIDGLDANGTCTLVMSKSGATSVTQEAGTQILGSYSVCKGFDVDTTNLVKGSWQAKITYKGSLGQGSVEQVVEI